MLSVAEAQMLVLYHAAGRTARLSIASGDLLGAFLAEDVVSGVDSPPHDKAMVDGYAIVATDLGAGEIDLLVLEEVIAGAVPTQPVVAGAATRIMTGAPLPVGADAVVMIEHSKLLPASGAKPEQVRIADAPPKPGQNIMPRGLSIRAGQTVLSAGREMNPAAIGVAAEVGCRELAAYAPTTVAVLATGNELVEAGRPLWAGQVCNSNGPMLGAAARRAGAQVTDLGIARDEIKSLSERIAGGLKYDILILSGGVSAGVLDLVPAVLRDLGVEEIFHKVALKPGKPLWFGVKRRAALKTLVFGLPGNPVSGLVCFELFVAPAIRRMRGYAGSCLPDVVNAELTADFQQRSDRPTYFPARLDRATTPPRVTPVAWRGAADLYGFSQGNALAIFPAGDHLFQAGEVISVTPI